MKNRLTKEQIEDLLEYCGTEPTFWRDNDMLCCCPIHGESNPSMGVNSDIQAFHCFACNASGGFEKLLYLSRPDDFGYNNIDEEHERKTWGRARRKAKIFLKERYELEFREVYKRVTYVKKFDDLNENNNMEDNKTIPIWKIAPFQSGKKTYHYFYRRGFDNEDVEKFKIGFDEDNKTVTIPVFNEDNKLVGIIGRYIDSNRRKNERYKIYNHFNRSGYLYPENFLEVHNNTIILVEGQFDAIKLHKLGYCNSLAIMTDELSNKQVDFLITHCDKIIYIGDNDSRGLESREKNYKKLKNLVDFYIVDYPKYGKDVCDWNDKDIKKMIKKAYPIYKKKIRRFNE